MEIRNASMPSDIEELIDVVLLDTRVDVDSPALLKEIDFDSEPRGAWFHRLLPSFARDGESTPEFTDAYVVLLHHVMKHATRDDLCVIELRMAPDNGDADAQADNKFCIYEKRVDIAEKNFVGKTVLRFCSKMPTAIEAYASLFRERRTQSFAGYGAALSSAVETRLIDPRVAALIANVFSEGADELTALCSDVKVTANGLEPALLAKAEAALLELRRRLRANETAGVVELIEVAKARVRRVVCCMPHALMCLQSGISHRAATHQRRRRHHARVDVERRRALSAVRAVGRLAGGDAMRRTDA
jgi:hypothetical protein